MRAPISEAERLTLTLRFLVSGDDQESLAFSFQLSARKNHCYPQSEGDMQCNWGGFGGDLFETTLFTR